MKCLALFPTCLLVEALLGGRTFAAGNPLTGPINVTSNTVAIANGDAVWGLTDCTVTKNSPTVICPSPAAYVKPTGTYAPGQSFIAVLIADDAGSSGGATPHRIPYIGTITNATGGGTSTPLTLTLSGTLPAYSNAGTLGNHVARFDVTSGGGGTGYEFGTFQTLACGLGLCPTGSGSLDALGTPGIMAATGTPSVVGSGSGGNNGTCSLTSVSQIGIGGMISSFVGTVSGGALVSVSIASPGTIANDVGSFSSMASAYADPLIGCGFTVSPTIDLQYTVLGEQIVPGTGIYQGRSPCNAGTATPMNVGMGESGSGLTVTCSALGETYPGSVSYGTDNTNALRDLLGTRGSAAMGTMNYGAAIGFPVCLYFPSGGFLAQPLNASGNGSGSNIAQGYGCWLGDEHYHSNIFVIPNSPGDLFAWVDSNQNSSLLELGNTQNFQNFTTGSSPTGNANQGGSSFRNLAVIGDRLSTTAQNALAFYGPTNFLYIDNIVIDYMLGRAIYAGAPDNSSTPLGDLNESVVQNIRLEDDGNGPSIPAFEITASGTAQGSNTDSLSNIRIYQPIGTGLWIHNGGTSQFASDFRLTNVFIEGSKVSATNGGGDLLELGDSTMSAGNGVSGVLGRNIHLVNPTLKFAALHVTGNAASSAENIDIEGAIFGNANDIGRGLQVEVCTQCSVKLASNSSTDYNLVVGSNSGTTTVPASPCANSSIDSPGLIYDGEGAEPGLTSCIDKGAAGLVQFPVRTTLGSLNSVNAGSNPLSDLFANVAIGVGVTLTMGSASPLPVKQSAPTWTIVRSGPTAAFTDYWDTASNIISQLGGSLNTAVAGQFYHLRICNRTASVETIEPQALSNVLGTVTVGAGVCLPITMTIVSTGTVAFVGG